MNEKMGSSSRRAFINHLLGAAGALSAAKTTAKGHKKLDSRNTSDPKLQDPILYFNDDSNILEYSGYPVTPEILSNYIRIYAARGVDIFSWDVVVNGVCWYKSAVAPGINEGRTNCFDLNAFIAANNVHSLIQAEANPPAFVAEECHRYGMLMMAGFRIGLGIPTGDLSLGGGIFYNPNTLKLRDKVVRVLPPKDRWYDGWADPKIVLVLDWSYPEVRELVLAPIREVVEKFDVDGIELETQGTIFFDADQAVRKASIITDFIRQVRQVLDNAARKKGRDRLLLGVRHFDDAQACLRFGLDVKEWIKQDLVDIDMPSQDNPGGIDFIAPIEEFVGFCKGHRCIVLPTIIPGEAPFAYGQYNDFDHRAYTLPQLRAVVESWYRRGASGVSTFNYQHRRSDSVTWEESIAWLEQLADPAFVQKGERSWPLFGTTLSFKEDEVGIRKTIAVPRYAVVPLGDGNSQMLRFQALELSPNDVMEIDVDGVRVPHIHTEFTVSRVHRGWSTGRFSRPQEGDSHLYPAFTVEVPLPNLCPSSQIGFRLTKRHFLSEIQIREISIVTLAHARESAQGLLRHG